MIVGAPRRLALVAGAAFLATVTACADEWETLPIRSYDVEGEARVRVEGHCNDDGRVVVVDETGEQVALRLEVRGEPQGDCLACPSVTLDRPLGDRAVLDASTGEPVPFEPDVC